METAQSRTEIAVQKRKQKAGAEYTPSSFWQREMLHCVRSLDSTGQAACADLVNDIETMLNKSQGDDSEKDVDTDLLDTNKSDIASELAAQNRRLNREQRRLKLLQELEESENTRLRSFTRSRKLQEQDERDEADQRVGLEDMGAKDKKAKLDVFITHLKSKQDAVRTGDSRAPYQPSEDNVGRVQHKAADKRAHKKQGG